MNQHVSVITLGVRDFAGARRFYESLGWSARQEDDTWACYVLVGEATAVAFYPWDELAEDAGVPPQGEGFRGVTLAYNVRSQERVDEVLADAERAGATIPQPPRKRDWGGYSGYFADPEGYLWEVATGATQLPFSE